MHVSACARACVRERVCALARTCARACERACVRERACVCVRACVQERVLTCVCVSLSLRSGSPWEAPAVLPADPPAGTGSRGGGGRQGGWTRGYRSPCAPTRETSGGHTGKTGLEAWFSQTPGAVATGGGGAERAVLSGWGAERALRLRTRPAALREGAAAANQDKGHACAESKMREHSPPGAAMGYGHQTRGLWPPGCLGLPDTWAPGSPEAWTPGTAGGAPGAGEFREGVA